MKGDLFAGLLALVVTVLPLRAWDPGGHLLVGEIAWQHCTPTTREAVDKLVARLDVRFNEGRPYHFVTIGCWMDDLRSLPRDQYPWAKWHYVDGPKTADGSAFQLPEPPHVVWAIGENLKTLRDPAAPQEARAQAVGQLFHWIGDIHQPLHATTWDDRGGNGYFITGVPFSDLMPHSKPNLHTYWDKAYRFGVSEGRIVELWRGPETAERPSAPGEGIIASKAKALMEQFPKETMEEWKAPDDAEVWARESHILGCTKGYPPGEHPRDTGVGRIEPSFVEQNLPIAQRRVAIAGYRLARVLESLFAEK